MGNIGITEFNNNDIFVLHVDVGSMNIARATEYMDIVKEKFEEHFQNAILVVAGKNQSSSIEIQILRKV